MEIFDWADDSSDRSNIFTRMSSFSNHPSTQMIKDKHQNPFNFKFELVSTDQVIKFIDEIDCNKSSSGDIPAKIIKIAKEEIAKPRFLKLQTRLKIFLIRFFPQNSVDLEKDIQHNMHF